MTPMYSSNGQVLRRAGESGGPALFFVHALGDSSLAFDEILSTSLGSGFELLAPDWPRGAGLDDLALWLAGAIGEFTPDRPVGLVGHSLGAAVAARAVKELGGVVGLFAIEGNLTAADAYLSGLATAFGDAEAYRSHLLERIGAMARRAAPGPRKALWRYHDSLTRADPEPLWRIGCSAAAASENDALGEEYRALSVPTLYYWSRESTPFDTRLYIENHGIPNVEFAGGHWPMVEEPDAAASQIAAFFEPLFTTPRVR